MASSSRPAWLIEALDVVERRGGLLRAVIAALVVAGALLAFLAPGVLPPRPLVGAVVAVSAILVGLAVAIAVDAGDGIIRGPRHVRAVGGELVGVLPSTVAPAAARDLGDAVLDARGGRRVVLGLTATGHGIDAAAWTDALGVAIASRDASVLVVDLASGATPDAGLVEVVRDGASLGHTVAFERDIKLARLGAGRDIDEALRAAVDLPVRLPRDLEVLLVALPPLSDGDVLAAAGALDAVLLLAASDTTTRVRLQAGIEALEKADTVAQVVLIDDRTAGPVPSSTSTWTASGDASRPPASVAQPTSDRPPATGESVPATAAREDDARVPEPEAGAPEPEAVAPEPEPEAVAPEPEPEPVAAAPEPEREPEPPVSASAPAAEVEPAREQPRDQAPEEPQDPEVPADGRRAMERDPDGGRAPDAPADPVDLGRRPAPSVRVVRDLPPSARPRTPPASDPVAAGPAGPQDPVVAAAAAAASLADRLAGAPLPTRPEPAATPAPGPTAEPAAEEAPEAAREPAAEEAPEAAPEAAPAPDPVPEAASEPAAEAAGEPGPSGDLGGGAVDDTEEIPSVRADRLADPGPPADDLRTTAQLAILMDELQERDEDR